LAAAALWLRTHDLDQRPMHADEANQGVKTGELVEAGRYAFDPRDHHGPTLYYLGAAVATLRGQATLAALDETSLRLVPALAGAMAVPLLVMLARRREPGGAGLGGPAALAAGAFLALAPPAQKFFFTARGSEGVRGAGSRLGVQRADGSGLEILDFHEPDHIGWLPYCFFRDGRRAILMSLELIPGWRTKTFDEYYPQSKTHLWLYDM
jgi:hypothetical protein